MDELDLLIQRMEEAGESEESIAEVVQLYVAEKEKKEKPQKDAPVEENASGASGSEDIPLMLQKPSENEEEVSILDQILNPIQKITGKAAEGVNYVKKETSRLLEKNKQGDEYKDNVFEHNYENNLTDPIWRGNDESEKITESEEYKESREAEKRFNPMFYNAPMGGFNPQFKTQTKMF